MAPQYERQKDLAALINSPDVLAKLGGPIDRIEWTGGAFKVSSGRCAVMVRVIRGELKSANGLPMAGSPPVASVEVGDRMCEN